MKEYTVLLLYPDYIAEQYGQETYLAWVEAPDPESAVTAAQKEAMGHNSEYDDSPEDFYPLMVTEGHHSDLTPERWR